MTLFTTRGAMALAATVGLAGLIGVTAPAASATNPTSSHSVAARHAPVPFIYAAPSAGIGRFEIAASGPRSVCTIKVAPLGRLPRPARPSAGVLHDRPRLTKLKPTFLPAGAKGDAVVCGPAAGVLTCAGAVHRVTGAHLFARLPTLRIRALELGGRIKRPATRAEVAFGRVIRLTPLACRSSK